MICQSGAALQASVSIATDIAQVPFCWHFAALWFSLEAVPAKRSQHLIVLFEEALPYRLDCLGVILPVHILTPLRDDHTCGVTSSPALVLEGRKNLRIIGPEV